MTNNDMQVERDKEDTIARRAALVTDLRVAAKLIAKGESLNSIANILHEVERQARTLHTIERQEDSR